MSFSSFRLPSPSALLSTPRQSLNASLFGSIDAVLKDVKVFSRRLQIVVSAQHDELQILERLYYKGKNQHRSALFWKRVVEIRRYGRRLDGVGIPDIVERLRRSFFAEESQHSAKSLKGSWTHLPNVSHVSFVLERLSACLALVEKMRERLLEAYRSFSLAMQSGAFIQLVLTLAAIASRMHLLMTEVHEILIFGWTACHRILQVLDPREAQSFKFNYAGIKAVPGATTGNPGQIIPEQDRALCEDIGLPVSRQPEHDQEAQIHSSALPLEPGCPGAHMLTSDQPILDRVVVLQQLEGSFASKVPEDDSQQNTLISRDPVAKSRKESRKDDVERKKKRKKRDEIDEIFGA